MANELLEPLAMLDELWAGEFNGSVKLEDSDLVGAGVATTDWGEEPVGSPSRRGEMFDAKDGISARDVCRSLVGAFDVATGALGGGTFLGAGRVYTVCAEQFMLAKK